MIPQVIQKDIKMSITSPKKIKIKKQVLSFLIIVVNSQERSCFYQKPENGALRPIKKSQ